MGSKFSVWLEARENLDESFGRAGVMGLAAAAGMAGAAQAKNAGLNQYMVNSQSFSEKPAVSYNLKQDEIQMRSITALKESIRNSIQSKGYYSSFLIEIIEQKEANQKSLVVEVSATVNAESEQQAKQMVTRDVMAAVGKFSKGGNLQKMLSMGNTQVTQIGENQVRPFKVVMKYRVTPTSFTVIS